MLIASLPLLFTNIVALVMVSVVVLSRTVPLRLRLTLIATILSLVLWQDFIFIADNTQSDLILWNTLVFVWPTVAILSCFAFIRSLRGDQYKTQERPLPAYLLLAATLVQFLPIISMQIFSSAVRTPSGLEFVREPGYYVYLCGLAIALILVITEVIVRRATSKPKTLERYAINTVLATVLIAGSYGILINVMTPLLTGGQTLIGWGVLIVDIFVIGLGLSIFRGRLLDIRFYAVRATAYVLSLSTLAAAYIVLVFPISQVLFRYDASSGQNFLNVIFALGLALVFQPVRQFFDRITNRIFYRDNYNNDEFFAGLNHILVSTTDLKHLLERVSQYIAVTFKSDQAFFVLQASTKYPILVGTESHVQLPPADSRHIEQYLKTHDRVLQASFINDSVPMQRLLISHRVELVLALTQGEEYIGFLCLGDHKVSNFVKRDLRVLTTVLDELTIAIQNALSVQQVKDLNANLEHKIATATKELRGSNAQLQRLDEAKDEFISMASHQLRTPLTSIKGYISMLMEGDVGTVSPEQKHLLREAFISSERMVRLIGDFLNVSRLQTGKFVIDKHPVDLAHLVQTELEALEPNAAARGLKFEYKRPKNIPRLSLDENKIQQVIMNFADNAIYYSKDASKIKVNLKLTKGFVEFTVVDHGIGVPKAQQDQLFNKFFRATNARLQRPDGTGVGLFLAKKVIDAHHGQIVFSSELDKGSMFGFKLPVDKLRASRDTH